MYAITPEIPARVLVDKVRRMLRAAPTGRVALQLRAKHLPTTELRALGSELRALTDASSVPLLVNGDLALAAELGADGVQLPERAAGVRQARERLGARALIGASRHELRAALDAGEAGASFVLLSPVFAVPGKGAPLGLGGFEAIARKTLVPVIALGGIDAPRASMLVQHGAHGVAAMRELFDAADPARALEGLLLAVDEGRRRVYAAIGV
ncbi:MAG: thiamine phosphate synthase [Polyangiales bacterium]